MIPISNKKTLSDSCWAHLHQIWLQFKKRNNHVYNYGRKLKNDFLIIKNPAKTKCWKGCKSKTATDTKPKNRIKSNNRKTNNPNDPYSFYGGKLKKNRNREVDTHGSRGQISAAWSTVQEYGFKYVTQFINEELDRNLQKRYFRNLLAVVHGRILKTAPSRARNIL